MCCCHRAALTVAVLLLAAGAAHAQTVPDPANLRGDSAQTRKRLIDARQKVIAGKHAEAIDDLQRVLDDAGDDLISADGKQYRPARFVVHQILLTLPPDVLKGYQNRVEEPTRKLLDAGRRGHDPRPLWQLIDRYFVSRSAAEGLLLLGDLLFERGQFRTAELLWRRLLPPEADGAWRNLLAEDADISHPVPAADPAGVRARVALAMIFQGESERARQELLRLAALHPGASGSIAGKTGPYAETLLPLLTDPPRVPQDGGNEHDWPTFAGGPSRSGRVPGRLPRYWPSQPTWRKSVFSDEDVKRVIGFGRRPYAHPIISEGKVYVTDGSGVLSLELRTGVRTGTTFRPQPLDVRQTPDPAFSLTAAEGRLFARLGTPLIFNPDEKDATALGCFTPARNAVIAERVWRLAPIVADVQNGVWEGAPLVARGRMWAALARSDGARVVHSVACFDPVDPDHAPDRAAWLVEVCDGALPPPPETATHRKGRPRHELLTLAGRNVVFCSNAGAVVAIDAATGRRAWAFKYPRAARRLTDAARSPDPAPAVAFGGRVFVAPADAEHVYALDEETGVLLWESGTVEAAKLLGVARNRVIVSVGGSIRGLRGLSVANGSHRADDGGWVQHSGGGVATTGRGLVADDLIAWPTSAGLWFIDPESGQPVPQGNIRVPYAAPRDSVFGNLAYADGVLVVVTASEVWGYVAEGTSPPLMNLERKTFTERIGAVERDLGDGKADARRRLLDVVMADLPRSMRAWAAARLALLADGVPADLRAVLTPELEEEWLHLSDGSLQTLGQLVAARGGEKPPEFSRPGKPAGPGDRTRDDAPTLTAKSCIDHTLRLPAGACPLSPLPGAPLPPRTAFALSGANLLAVPLEGGAIATRTAAGTFTHVGEFDGGIVAIGPHVVALYGPGCDPLWVFRVPELDPLPSRVGQIGVTVGEPPEPAGLSSLVFAGSWLFGRLGEHTLIALDLQTRQVAWLLGAHGQPRHEPIVFPNTPRFEPHFFVNGEVLIAQLSDGRRWTIDVATGHVLDASGIAFRGSVPAGYGEETARVAWVQPPVKIEPSRLAIADGPGLVRTIDLDSGKATTLYAADGPSSLSGEPPQVRAWNGNVLVAVRRNYGVELDLAEVSGKLSAWTTPAFFDAARIDLKNADADPLRVFVPAGDKLFAVKLKDGSAAWEVELPESHGTGGWVVRAGKKAVVVYPEVALPSEPVADVAGRAVRSFTDWPFAHRLPVFGFRMYDAWVARRVPVLLLDPQTGKLLERFDLPARGPAVAAWFEGDLAVVATGDRVVWMK